MKTPEEIYEEVWSGQLHKFTIPKFDDVRVKEIAIECMKRFGFQCWLDSTKTWYEDGCLNERAERKLFNRYLQNLYLNQIAKQAQDDGDYK